MQTRGVILQAGYRTFSGTPVVHLYGRMEDGATFLVREHRQRPHFYVRSGDAAVAAQLTERSILESGLRNFAGEPVSRVEVRVPSDAPPIRDRLRIIHLREHEHVSSLYLSDPQSFPAAWKALLDSATTWTDKEKASSQQRRDEAWQLCQDLARETRILEVFAKDFRAAGVVGKTDMGSCCI